MPGLDLQTVEQIQGEDRFQRHDRSWLHSFLLVGYAAVSSTETFAIIDAFWDSGGFGRSQCFT